MKAAVPARPVEGVHRDLVGVHQRLRQQAPLQPGRLGLAQLHLAQPAGVLVGALALDRVPQRPGQQHPVDLALDQIVLGALGDRGDARGARRSDRSARRPRRRSDIASTWRSPSSPCASGSPRSSRTQSTPAIRAGASRRLVATIRSTGGLGLGEQLTDQEGVARRRPRSAAPAGAPARRQLGAPDRGRRAGRNLG